MRRLIVGIDEAGRGPLAGPVAVGVAAVPEDFDWNQLPGVTDSKRLSPKQRAILFQQAKTLQQTGQLHFAVSMVSAKVIDRIGIVSAIQLAMKRALERLNADPATVFVKLDGGLRAPEPYRQETIIKGDQKEKVIGLASVCAKETRDKYMRRLSEQSAYAPYDFEVHKGYGTKAHRAAIAKQGITPEHRVSYCKNCIT
jgi:ribonuclease HII